MNNTVLIESLRKIGLPNAEPTGRNDICVQGKKVSGSAYKLNLGKKDGSGRKSLHHGTMLLNLDLTALDKYLSPNKAKLLSKGVDSVVSRVMNIKERIPHVNHELYSQALAGAFRQKWTGRKSNEKMLRVSDLEKIDKLMEIYEGYKKWEWRFGETPQFTNSIEKKFDWALIDLEFNVEKGRITKGKVYSDCLVPNFIDEINVLLESGLITYDQAGVEQLGNQLRVKFADNEAITGKYIPELVQWVK